MRPNLFKISLIILVLLGLILPSFPLNLVTNQIQAEQKMSSGGAPLELKIESTARLSQNKLAPIIQNGKVVMFEASHNQDPYNDCSYWIKDLEAAGYTVLVNTEPLSSQVIEKADVLIVMVLRHNYGISSPYTASEAQIIKQYVSKGGGLMLLADHSVYSWYAQEISSAFGITLNGERILTQPTFSSANFDVEHPIMAGINSIRYNWYTTITPGTASPLIWENDGDAVAVTFSEGSGRGAVFGDSNWPLSIFNNYYWADNSLLALQTVDWLAGQIGWEKPEKWSFAIVTDLHIGINDPDDDYKGLTWNDDSPKEYSPIDDVTARENLKRIVDIINAKRELYNTDFVVVDGDIADSAELSEFREAIEILNNLEIPWIPIIGNHDVWPYYGANPDWTDPWAEMAFGKAEVGPNKEGADIFFNNLFNGQYEKLRSSGIFQNFKKADVPVWNPETSPKRYNYFQNFFFDYKGYHFIGLDFNARDDAPYFPWPWKWKGVPPEGDLHSFPGGTWDWFTNHLENYLSSHPTSTENVILFVHHPFNQYMDPKENLFAGFDGPELNTMSSELEKYKDNIWGAFAGHTHPKKLTFYDWPGKWRLPGIAEKIMTSFEIPANFQNPYALLVQISPNKEINYSEALGDGMIIKAMSPVDLEVIDPDGFIISKQLNEIPGAVYTEADINGDGKMEDMVRILDRKLGDYKIKVTPESNASPTSTYSLEVSTLEDSFGYTPIILAQDAPIGKVPQTYIFKSKEKESTQITYTGDLTGQFSDSVKLTATLTDKDGNPLSNKEITFTIGSQSTSTITDENGIATASLVLNQVPGKYYLVDASFFGDEDYLPSSDTQSFEIQKENVVINVENKEGFYDDNITLEANVKDDDGQLLLKEPKEIEFKLADQIIGTTTIDETGKAKINLKVNLIPKELTETYPILATFAGNGYYNPAEGQGKFTLKSAKWLKEDAISELEQAKTENRRIDKKVDKIIWLISQSLDETLWRDASRLAFFENKGEYKKIDFKNFLKKDRMKVGKIKVECPRLGVEVFHYEKVATRLMMNEIRRRRTPDEIKDIFEKVINKLVKTDMLLAKVSLYDAKNTPIQNPKFQKIVEKQIERAEKELGKAYLELQKGRPDKAISRLAKSWLHSQLAIKFATHKISFNKP